MKASPAFFGGGAGGGFVGPLDGYTTGLWGAYSVSRLLTAYSAQAMTVRDTTSGSLQDIGFTSLGAFDSAALASFLGSHNGVCRDLANQQGNSARGITQATAAFQPRVAVAGVFDGKLTFDGSDDLMGTTVTASGTPAAFTCFLRGRLRSTGGTQILLEHSGDYNSNNACVSYYDAGALSLGVHQNPPAGYSRSDFTGDAPNNNVQCWRFDKSQVTSAAMTKLFINGTADTRNANGDSGTLPSGVFSSNFWYLGNRANGLLPAFLDVHTLLIYETALSDGNVASVSTIVAALP